MSFPRFRVILSLSLLLISLATESFAQALRHARVIAEKANFRETPSFLGLAEGEVTEGTLVTVLDQKLPWYVVRVGDRVGWMHGATLQFVSAAEISEPGPVILSTTPEVAPARSVPPREATTPTSRGGGYIRGPRGGCYYISGSGRKVYVDRSLCN